MSKIENQFEIFSKALVKESDRGCVLVGAAMMDYMLGQVLRHNFFSDDKGPRKKVVNSLFEVNGPFSSFWSKIQFVYALGIIRKDHYHDLEIIRKVRNVVAHNFDVVSFDDKKITSKTETLKSADEAVKNIAPLESKKNKAKTKTKKISGNISKSQLERTRFSLSVSHIGGRLHGMIIGEIALPLDILKKLGEEK